MRSRLGGRGYVGSRCFIVGRTYVLGRRFVLRAAGKFLLCAAFDLLGLFSQSLHFLLTLQETEGPLGLLRIRMQADNTPTASFGTTNEVHVAGGGLRGNLRLRIRPVFALHPHCYAVRSAPSWDVLRSP